MKPNSTYLRQPPEFWADVRTIGEVCGYTRPTGGYEMPPESLPKAKRKRKTEIRIPSIEEICTGYESHELATDHICDDEKVATEYGERLLDYFELRSASLQEVGDKQLMNAEDAAAVYNDLVKQSPNITSPEPMNKQKGGMKEPAYLTAITNHILAREAPGYQIDFNPGELTKLTRNRRPLRTLSRRLDGAFPKPVNPIAIWEIKEYYHSTTFGSRVADGVYETMLDGRELNEAENSTGTRVEHILIIDSRFTWWQCGKSYLCRLYDMLHMGLVDEVLCGREVVNELPRLVAAWRTKIDALKR